MIVSLANSQTHHPARARAPLLPYMISDVTHFYKALPLLPVVIVKFHLNVMGSNMAAGKQQKPLSPSFASKA